MGSEKIYITIQKKNKFPQQRHPRLWKGSGHWKRKCREKRGLINPHSLTRQFPAHRDPLTEKGVYILTLPSLRKKDQFS